MRQVLLTGGGEVDIWWRTMARNTLEHHADGSFVAEGNVPLAADASAPEVGVLLKRFVVAMHEIRKRYTAHLAGDGRLIGQERFSLAESLDEALNELILLRAKFEGRTHFTAINIKYDYRFQVRIEGRRWVGRGLLGIYQKVNFKSFDMWLSRVLKERLTELIRFYGTAQLDGVIDSRERIVLNRSVDRLIFGIVLIRINLETGDIG